ncbi:MAG: DNA polymerase III subunit delta' [Patescibacteria group bacterium]
MEKNIINWQVIGHKHITSYLEQAIISDRLVHAWLFHGPKMIGKRKLAKQFAKTLLCFQGHENKENLNNIPCNQCEQCVEFNKKIHPDFFTVEKGKQEKNISVEQIRELKNRLSSKSLFKSYKIAIIYNADSLSLSASNALLKTLEEPLGKTIIILIAQKIDTLPKTILSRTQKIKFLPVAQKEIYEYLIKERNVEHNLALNLASLADGKPERAMIFLNNQALLQSYTNSINTFLKLISAKEHQKISFVEELIGDQKKIADKINIISPLLNLWQTMFRDILLLKFSSSAKIINISAKQELIKLGPYFSSEKLHGINVNIEKTKRYLNQNVNPKLALENLILNF